MISAIAPASVTKKAFLVSTGLHVAFFSLLALIALVQSCKPTKSSTAYVFNLVAPAPSSSSFATPAPAASRAAPQTISSSPTKIPSPSPTNKLPPEAKGQKPPASAKKVPSAATPTATRHPAGGPAKISYEQFLKTHPKAVPASPTSKSAPAAPAKPSSMAAPVLNPQAIAQDLTAKIAFSSTATNFQSLGTPSSSGQNALSHYVGSLKAAIDALWEKPAHSNPSTFAVVEFTVHARGAIGAPKIIDSSGDAAFNQSVLQALKGLNALTPPPEGLPCSIRLTFRTLQSDN